MTRRPVPLGEADLARLLRHLPDPPAPSAGLTDRVVAAALAVGNAGRPAQRRRRVGRPLWWTIAVVGVAGAVTAAAANGGRFELAKVLTWPQAIIRAAGLAPAHRHGPAVVRLARPISPAVSHVAAAPAAPIQARPLAAVAAPPPERFATPRPGPGPLALPPRAPRLARGPVLPHRLLAHSTPAVRPVRDIPAEPEAAFRDADRQSARADLTTPSTRPESASAATAPRADVERPADEALRFHDADEYARRQQADRGLDSRSHAEDARARAADSRPFAAARDNQQRPWARADQRPWARADVDPRRWQQRAQAWRQRADNRPHPFRHPSPRGRRG